MSTATVVDSAPRYWSEEPSSRPDRVRLRARIGGLHCSLCTGTIEKALGRQPGVDKVAVSLTHEQALIEYDPQVARPEELFRTLRDIGYSVSDPRKLRPFEEEERDLVREGRRFLAATAFSLIAVALVARPAGFAALARAGRGDRRHVSFGRDRCGAAAAQRTGLVLRVDPLDRRVHGRRSRFWRRAAHPQDGRSSPAPGHPEPARAA